MAGKGEAVRVTGLAELGKSLKKIDSELPKMIRLALNKAAGTVKDEAYPHVPKKTGRAAKTLKAKSTRTEARVSGGGNRAEYYPWLDFGGRVGKNKSVSRKFFTDGRYLYPAYFKLRDTGEFEDILSDALMDVIRSAGLEVR